MQAFIHFRWCYAGAMGADENVRYACLPTKPRQKQNG
jgi:hypothetical protein